MEVVSVELKIREWDARAAEWWSCYLSICDHCHFQQRHHLNECSQPRPDQMLNSDWSRMITWPEYWPLVGDIKIQCWIRWICETWLSWYDVNRILHQYLSCLINPHLWRGRGRPWTCCYSTHSTNQRPVLELSTNQRPVLALIINSPLCPVTRIIELEWSTLWSLLCCHNHH